jgi:predicted tellurium resistance membrane protein TerC
MQKGYIYFALVYALIVELLNLRMRKNQQKWARKRLQHCST